ncbi:MAG TPA: hypothetical protein VJ521_04185 [Acidobacteriota bacterium]|nr:hypothetical protein [Acidobacteriota bacterium]
MPVPALVVTVIQSSFDTLPVTLICFPHLLFSGFHPTFITAISMSAVTALADVKNALAPTTASLA